MSKWSISTDEEHYRGEFNSREEAIEEAKTCDVACWVGKCVPPAAPESFWCADDWLERVWDDDDYSGDWAEGGFSPSNEQIAELECMVRDVIRTWMEHHDLRPKFFNIDPNSVERVIPDGSET